MDNESPPQEAPKEPQVDWTSYHENNQAPVDAGAMAALVRRVGGELQKIDSQSVSNSTARAERIDKQKLINELRPQVQQQPPPPPQHVVSSPPKARAAPPPIQQPPVQPPSVMTKSSGSEIQDLEKRLSRLESSIRTLRKTKKIKRGTSYKVSSNSVKGVIKDAELVAEFVISELAKGVKSITIKLDESTDTQ